MPFIRTTLPETTSKSHRDDIVKSIHDALVSSIDMPADELFNLVSNYNHDTFYYSRSFNGIARSDNLIVVEIIMRRGRSDAMKRDLYAQIAQRINKSTGTSIKDVMIFTYENDYSDWSVGNGVFAMNLAQQRGAD
ncbi:MAG: tautomerase family protein [Hyphomicrobiales bacterium]